jgi:hypothetical protein
LLRHGGSPRRVEIARAETMMRLARSEALQAIRALRSWRSAFAAGRYANMAPADKARRLADLGDWLQAARKDHRRWRRYRDALNRGEDVPLLRLAAE